MDLKLWMIGLTFAMGVLLVLVAIVALFRKVGARDGGTLEFFGMKMSGKGAPVLFLGVGAVLLLSGFGWASSREEVVKKTEEVRAKDTEVREAVHQARQATEAQQRVGADLKALHLEYQAQVELSRALAVRAPAVVRSLPPEKRLLLEKAPLALPSR